MSKRTSILIYCGDVLGLGHQRRNIAIASRLVRELPDADVLLLTSLSAGFVPCPDRVDLVKLPSLRKKKDGRVGARTLGMRPKELKRLRRGIIGGVAREFRPDLVLVDHKPTGVWDELLPSLERWRKKPNGPATVLGVRDILDEPASVVRKWKKAGVYEVIERLYDQVLIYGSSEIYPTRERYRLGQNTPADYCGYICPVNGLRGKDVARRELGLVAGKVAVVTAGGGADGLPMMKASLEALRCLQGQLDLELVCVAGPFMEADQLAELRRLSADLPARVIWCADQLPLYFEAADLIVTMAGYNTLLEAVRQGRPTLVLPRTGPSAEQGMRAREMSRRGIIRAVDESGRRPARLAALMAEQLTTPGSAVALPEMDGLQRTVKLLRAQLDARAARIAATENGTLQVVGGGETVGSGR